MLNRLLIPLLAAVALSGCLSDSSSSGSGVGADASDSQMTELGRQLFHDVNLSANGDQSCASCHSSTGFFVDPDNTIPVSAGSGGGLFGTRNTPIAAYTSFVPALHQEEGEGQILWVGGLFLDGRVDTLEEQATKPFFNPVEMNNGTVVDLVGRLRGSPSRAQFEAVFGGDSLVDAPGDEDEQIVLQKMARAIAAFERTPAVNAFSSKFDAYLKGLVTLSAQEQQGLAIFVREDKGNCAACHVMSRGANGEPPVFTDFTYDNLGVPRNTTAPFFASDFVDAGLETTLLARGVDSVSAAAVKGKFRVPTLRNVAVTAPYMHNGVFTDLREVVEFYNTRDTDPGRWGDTEVPQTVNHSELGNLGLNDNEIDALVAFMRTLTDGYF